MKKKISRPYAAKMMNLIESSGGSMSVNELVAKLKKTEQQIMKAWSNLRAAGRTEGIILANGKFVSAKLVSAKTKDAVVVHDGAKTEVVRGYIKLEETEKFVLEVAATISDVSQREHIVGLVNLSNRYIESAKAEVKSYLRGMQVRQRMQLI